MNEVLSAIKSRRSIKKFKPEVPVAPELIEQIIEAGLYAANGMNEQAAIIVAVTDRDVLAKLSKVNAEIKGVTSDPFYGAPAVLIVLARKTRLTRVEDGSLVMGNLMLAAHSLGVGSCWIHRARETFEMPEWQEWLKAIGVEGDYIGVGHCALGYPAMDYPTAPKRRENRVFYVK